jgi:hypothetical protein
MNRNMKANKVTNQMLGVGRVVIVAIMFIVLISFFSPTTISAIISIQPNLPTKTNHSSALSEIPTIPELPYDTVTNHSSAAPLLPQLR